MPGIAPTRYAGRRNGRIRDRRPGARTVDESKGDESKQGVAALERALSILEAFRDRSKGPGRTLAELSASTGLYKSTILRLCVSLERFSYIKRLENGAYSLGPAVFQLGQNYRSSFLEVSDVRPVLLDLVAKTRESASLWVLEGHSRVCLMRVDTPQHVRDTSIREGVRLPLDRGATSDILRAFSGGRGASENKAYKARHASSIGGYLPDLAGISRPVFGAGDTFVAALTLAGPSSRFTPAVVGDFEEALLDAARRITGVLGGSAATYVT